MPIFKLTESLSVAAQITPQDIPNLAAAGLHCRGVQPARW